MKSLQCHLVLLLLVTFVNALDYGFCSRDEDGSTLYFTKNTCLYDIRADIYLMISNNGKTMFFTDKECTTIDFS